MATRVNPDDIRNDREGLRPERVSGEEIHHGSPLTDSEKEKVLKGIDACD